MLNININGSVEGTGEKINDIAYPEARAIFGCIVSENGVHTMQLGTTNTMEHIKVVVELKGIVERMQEEVFRSLNGNEDMIKLAEKIVEGSFSRDNE